MAISLYLHTRILVRPLSKNDLNNPYRAKRMGIDWVGFLDFLSQTNGVYVSAEAKVSPRSDNHTGIEKAPTWGVVPRGQNTTYLAARCHLMAADSPP